MWLYSGLRSAGRRDEVWLDAPSPDMVGTRVRTQRQFKTFTDSLEQLADWVTEVGAQVIAMESTAMYWLPVWQMLERRCPNVKLVLVNPHQVQQVPGRKTDTTDTAWIASWPRTDCCGAAWSPPRRFVNCAISPGTGAGRRSIGIPLHDGDRAVGLIEPDPPPQGASSA